MCLVFPAEAGRECRALNLVIPAEPAPAEAGAGIQGVKKQEALGPRLRGDDRYVVTYAGMTTSVVTCFISSNGTLVVCSALAGRPPFHGRSTG